MSGNIIGLVIWFVVPIPFLNFLRLDSGALCVAQIVAGTLIGVQEKKVAKKETLN